MLLLVAPFVVLVAAHLPFSLQPTTANGCPTPIMPNTYGPGTSRASATLQPPRLETGLYLLLPLALLALTLTLAARHRDGSFALPLLCVAVHMAYLLPIGGDHFEYRPLDFYWPLLALPAAEGIAHLGSWISAGLRSFLPGPIRAARGEAYAVALLLPVLFYANSIQAVLLFQGAAIRERIHLFVYRTRSGQRRLAAGCARNASARRHLQRPAPAVIQTIGRCT